MDTTSSSKHEVVRQVSTFVGGVRGAIVSYYTGNRVGVEARVVHM